MRCPHCGKEIFDMGVTVSDILHNGEIPEGAKNLIIPYIQRLKTMEKEIAGSIELAYRRGKQDGEEGTNP